jgi:hypothetical protein
MRAYNLLQIDATHQTRGARTVQVLQNTASLNMAVIQRPSSPEPTSPLLALDNDLAGTALEAGQQPGLSCKPYVKG